MSFGSPVISPLAKLPAAALAELASSTAAFTRFLKFRRQSRAAIVGQIDKALGEIGVAGIERRLDLMDRDGAVEGAREAAVGNRRRIVRRRQKRLGLEPERHAEQRRQRKQTGSQPCQSRVRANYSVSRLQSARLPVRRGNAFDSMAFRIAGI